LTGLKIVAIKQFGEIAIRIELILLHLKPLKPFTKNDTSKDFSPDSAHKKARGVQHYIRQVVVSTLDFQNERGTAAIDTLTAIGLIAPAP